MRETEREKCKGKASIHKHAYPQVVGLPRTAKSLRLAKVFLRSVFIITLYIFFVFKVLKALSPLP